MSNWKGAWFLAKHELIKDRWNSLFSLGFVAYILLFTAPLYSQQIEGDNSQWASWATDFIFLSLLPILGFVLNRTMMGFWKTDAYSRKLAQWRTMPISPRQIAMGRLIQLAITLFTLQFIFFVLQFVTVRLMGAEIGVADFVLYGVCWFSYSLCIAVMYVYWEMGHSSKRYFLFCCIYMFFPLAASIGLTLLNAGNLVITTLRLIENGHGWLVFPAAGVGILALLIGTNRIEKRLMARNYMN